jgi:hypothetical protein
MIPKAGDEVAISLMTDHPAIAYVGECVQIDAPEDIPEIPGAPDAGTVREIFKEWGCDALALFRYQTEAGTELCFFALHTTTGKWADMRQQELRIEPLRRND